MVSIVDNVLLVGWYRIVDVRQCGQFVDTTGSAPNEFFLTHQRLRWVSCRAIYVLRDRARDAEIFGLEMYDGNLYHHFR